MTSVPQGTIKRADRRRDVKIDSAPPDSNWLEVNTYTLRCQRLQHGDLFRVVSSR